jgi:hypothetical protein
MAPEHQCIFWQESGELMGKLRVTSHKAYSPSTTWGHSIPYLANLLNTPTLIHESFTFNALLDCFDV